MKTLYLECNMGAAGDMLMAALYELLEDKQGFLDTMNSLGLPGVRLEAQGASTCGIAGTHMAVTVDGQEEVEPPPRRPPVRPISTTTGKNITTTNTSMGMSTATATSTTMMMTTTTGRSTTTIITTPLRATSEPSSTASPCPRR